MVSDQKACFSFLDRDINREREREREGQGGQLPAEISGEWKGVADTISDFTEGGGG